MSKYKDQAWVCFCEHSVKLFQFEVHAMEWIREKEQLGELWSITPAVVEYRLPGVVKDLLGEGE